MSFQSIEGGFQITEADQALLVEQRVITATVNQNFVKVGAIFLGQSSKAPVEKGWFADKHLDTSLQRWFEDPKCTNLNVGFNLQLGWMDIDIDSGDPEYNRCVLAAMNHLGVDTRFAFGRQSKGTPSHILIQLDEEESANFDYLKKFEPTEFKFKGNRYKTELRSIATSISKMTLGNAKQVVMPGSMYLGKVETSQYDISIWYTPSGKAARRVEEIAQTTPRRTSFNTIVTAIAFGTVLYFLKPHWVEGSRQVTATKICGWLARISQESAAINQNEILSQAVFCPVASDQTVESLIEFVCRETGDAEEHMRVRTYYDAARKIANNPDARIPGWPTVRQLLGDEVANALEIVLKPGSNVSVLTQFAERYIYDETDGQYIDRERFATELKYVHPGSILYTSHADAFVEVNGKKKPAFKLFEISSLRKKVRARDLFPDQPPGTIFRVDSQGDLVSDEEERKNTRVVFNTWTGWPIDAANPVDEATLAKCIAMLDQLFGYITRDNAEQALWLKQWIAWIFQHPAEKQQIAPVIVGGQGVGKSFFGNTFLQQLFKHLWGSASPRILEGNFPVEPFVNKMCVFIDEAKFHSEAGTDEIKKLIRNIDIGGSEKFQSARNYRIFARAVFASNRFDVNAGHTNMQDRALYFIRSYDSDFRGQSSAEFREWTGTLKPFFDEFGALLTKRTIREHYMHYFMTLPVDRHAIEDITKSSAADPDILLSNMSYPLRIAMRIIEEGWITEGADLSLPFTKATFNIRVLELTKSLGIKPIYAERVFDEFKKAGVVETYVEGGQKFQRFKYRIGKLAAVFGDAIGVPLESQFQFTEEEMGDNNVTRDNPVPWRGVNRAIFGKL